MRDFEPHPAINYYLYDYEAIFKGIADGELPELSTYKTLILNDLWFLMYFVMSVPDSAKPNHPFVVARCNEVGGDDGDYTLDIWAREHYKSTIKTIARNIQRICANPEMAVGIFSHKASVAKKFLFEIKQHLESSDVLKACFPDVLWLEPKREAPIWSLDEGLVLKRKTNRKESTIGAFGLIEGMPVGLHFDHMDFDDIVTADIGDSIDVMEKVKEKYDVAMNLGTDGGTHTVTGTIYHYNDPIVYIRDKVDPLTNKKAYKLRQYPSTHDGTPNGTPVFNSPAREAQLRLTKTYRTQQLCDPVPTDYATLKSDMLKYPEKLPEGCKTFVVVDQAGDDETNVVEGDDWAILTVKVNPQLSDIGASDVYITDIFAEPVGATEGIDLICQKYINSGMPMVLGIEKASHSATHAHVRETLKAVYGRNLTVVNDLKKHRTGVILLLRPQRRNKKRFIDLAVEWPLKNGKINVMDTVLPKYVDKLIQEMKSHPYGEDNILNTLAYLFADIIPQYNFGLTYEDELPEEVEEERYV